MLLVKQSPSHSCSLSLAWLGFKDWLAEKYKNGNLLASISIKVNKPKKTPLSLVGTSLILIAGLFLLAFIVNTLAPPAVSMLGNSGTVVVYFGVIGLSALIALSFFVILPALLANRLIRFIRYCCLRGFEISSGERKPNRIN